MIWPAQYVLQAMLLVHSDPLGGFLAVWGGAALLFVDLWPSTMQCLQSASAGYMPYTLHKAAFFHDSSQMKAPKPSRNRASLSLEGVYKICCCLSCLFEQDDTKP